MSTSQSRRTLEWTADVVDRLASLSLNGVSYGRAAIVLGVTRNATLRIAGRRRALGDVRFGAVGEAIKPLVRLDKPKVTRREKAAPKLVVNNTCPVLKGTLLFDPVFRRKSFAPDSLRLPIVDVGHSQCRFMANDDGLYCGSKTESGKAWCGFHSRLVYQVKK